MIKRARGSLSKERKAEASAKRKRELGIAQSSGVDGRRAEEVEELPSELLVGRFEDGEVGQSLLGKGEADGVGERLEKRLVFRSVNGLTEKLLIGGVGVRGVKSSRGRDSGIVVHNV